MYKVRDGLKKLPHTDQISCLYHYRQYAISENLLPSHYKGVAQDYLGVILTMHSKQRVSEYWFYW